MNKAHVVNKLKCRIQDPAFHSSEVVTYYQVTTPAGRANVEVAVAEVQFCIVVPLTTVVSVTSYDRVVPVIVVQSQNMAGSDGVIGTGLNTVDCITAVIP